MLVARMSTGTAAPSICTLPRSKPTTNPSSGESKY